MMYGQLLELLIFGGIAFFIISKLISVLGSTSEDDPARRRKSFFGENNLKDVTPSASDDSSTVLKPRFSGSKFPGVGNRTKFKTVLRSSLSELVTPENHESVAEGLEELLEKMPSFDLTRFVENARMAFKLIIDAVIQGNDPQLEELVDKRYLDNFKKRAVPDYAYLAGDIGKLSAQVSEIYVFGNNIFVKILFSDDRSNKQGIREEWTFSKSTLNDSPIWYLTNVDSENIAKA